MERNNEQAIYYTPPGSYDGLVKIQGRWRRVNELNRIDKTGWVRWQGPPTRAMLKALRSETIAFAGFDTADQPLFYCTICKQTTSDPCVCWQCRNEGKA